MQTRMGLGIRDTHLLYLGRSIVLIEGSHYNFKNKFIFLSLNNIESNVLPTKSYSDVMFCLQIYQGLIIDRSIVC